MPTQVILDPLGSTANDLYGVNFGVPSIHDPSVQYDAVYFGLGGADAIYDTDANGWIWAQAGDGSSFIGYGNGGDDVVVTFDGNDWLFGGAGNDILIANDGNDALIGEAGNDQLWGGIGSDQMNGGVGSDLLVGDAGTDFMVAGVDNDRDVMIGGPSGDEYIVARGGVVTGYSLLEPVPNPSSAGANIIWGFEIGIDVLKLPNANSVGGPLTGTSGSGFGSTYGYDPDLGLTGTMIQLGWSRGIGAMGQISDWVFLAGVETSITQLQGSGSLVFNDSILLL